MRPPLVSAVIPTYNRVQMVVEAVASALNQVAASPSGTAAGEGPTDPSGPPGAPRFELEVIVVDDCSSDGTVPWLQKFGAGDRRLTVVRLDRHTGFPGYVRNRGVQVSRGEWLAFLDSDDYWLPSKLAEQMDLHRRFPEIRISHTREEWQRGSRTVSQTSQRHRRRGDLFPDSLRKCVIGPSTVMMRRDLWEETGGFRPDLEVAEDYEYWLRITSTEPVGYVTRPLTVKRAGHGDQLSERYGEIERFRIYALRPLVDSGIFDAATPRRLRESQPFGGGGEWMRRGAPAQRLARGELTRKLRVYANGAEKRGRTEEAQELRDVAKRYDF